MGGGFCYNCTVRLVARSARQLAFVAFSLGWACGSGPGERALLERQVAAQLAAQGVAPRALRCEGSACRAELAPGQWVPLLLESRADGVHWRLGAVVVATAPLERYLAGELAALGLGARPRCGEPYVVLSAPRRTRCELAPHGVAWVDLRADGSYAIEVALGAAVAARQAGPSVSELEQRSRQLERGGEGSDEGSDDGSDGDSEDGSASPVDGEAGVARARGGQVP